LLTKSNDWRVAIESDLPIERLVNVDRSWICKHRERFHVVIRPDESDEIRQIRRQYAVDCERTLLAQLGPREPGSTSIEQQHGLVAQAAEIDRLARAGYPTGWADLASCWRIKALQPALRAAYRRVGWEKMITLVKRVDGWPDGLTKLVEAEFEKAKRVRPLLPWSPNDYLLRPNK
jgi:hypothetical protein